MVFTRLIALCLMGAALISGCASARPAASVTFSPDAAGRRCDMQSTMRRPGAPGLAACRAAVLAHPDSALLHEALALELAARGLFNSAGDQYNEILRLDPHNFPALYNLGLMLELQRRWAESLASFEQALPLTPDARSDQSVAWHIGVTRYHLGYEEEALRWFREAGALDSTDASAWSYAGVIAARLGRHAEAVSYWTRALKADPDFFQRRPTTEKLAYDGSRRVAGKQPPAVVTRMGLVRPRERVIPGTQRSSSLDTSTGQTERLSGARATGAFRSQQQLA